MSAIWTEKYRPSEFSQVAGQEHIVARIKALVESRNIPHMMFSGPPGTGKTTTAIIVAKKLFGESWRQNFLELNASDERGIDVIRVKVKDFARTKTIGETPFKIIYLDESDSLTKEAQQALRRTMENYANTCRFILSNNYSSKVLEPIQSRCAIFRFRPLTEEAIRGIIRRIEAAEGLQIDENAEKALIEAAEGDCRRLENLLQSTSVSTRKITAETIYEAAALAKPKEIKDVLTMAINNRFTDARDRLITAMTSNGLSGLDVIKQIQKEVLSLDWDQKKKMHMIDKCGEIEFRMVEGADEFVQLEALLSSLALLGP
ncbi:replication factor C small subunit [Candidatus Woesearchaeota archaeon]|nr:replication factor C small subunit [Candidatus Woesearchaeota archaeon]